MPKRSREEDLSVPGEEPAPRKRAFATSDIPGEDPVPLPVSNAPKRKGSERKTSHGDADEDFEMCQRLLIEANVAGGLIGTRGSGIRKLRADSDANIEIDSAVSRRAPRVVTVRGQIPKVVHAVQLISSRIAELEREFHKDENIPVALVLLVADSNLGAVLGRRGANIQETRRLAKGAKITINGDCLPRSTEKTIDLEGDEKAVHIAIGQVVAQLGSNQATKRTHVIPYRPYPDEDDYPRPRSGDRRPSPPRADAGRRGQEDSYITSAVVPVPNRLVGGVIGKKGSKIANMRVKSGAELRISDRDASGVRHVMVRGTRRQVDAAVKLVRQAVEEQEPGFSFDDFPGEGRGRGGAYGRDNHGYGHGRARARGEAPGGGGGWREGWSGGPNYRGGGAGDGRPSRGGREDRGGARGSGHYGHDSYAQGDRRAGGYNEGWNASRRRSAPPGRTPGISDSKGSSGGSYPDMGRAPSSNSYPSRGRGGYAASGKSGGYPPSSSRDAYTQRGNPSSGSRGSRGGSSRDSYSSSGSRGSYPPSSSRDAYPSSSRDAYPPSSRDTYPPSSKDTYPPSSRDAYPPTASSRGSYPPSSRGNYPQSNGDSYPPPPRRDSYPQPSRDSYPPSASRESYPPARDNYDSGSRDNYADRRSNQPVSYSGSYSNRGSHPSSSGRESYPPSRSDYPSYSARAPSRNDRPSSSNNGYSAAPPASSVGGYPPQVGSSGWS